MRRLDENMAEIEGVRVPDVDGARSARRVLTMEFIRGVKINDVAAMDAAGIDRDLIARRLLRAIIKQILVDGFFHADPHPGNVLVDTRDGTIVFLDLGLIGQLDRDQRFDLLDLMWSVVQKDAAGISAVMTRMSIQRGKVGPGTGPRGDRRDRLPVPEVRRRGRRRLRRRHLRASSGRCTTTASSSTRTSRSPSRPSSRSRRSPGR